MDLLKYQVDILGTTYNIVFANEEIRPKLKDNDGYMDNSIKEHEIIHAFFYESGVWNHSGCSDAWGQDETITDWIAIQFPKILQAFQECDCL